MNANLRSARRRASSSISLPDPIEPAGATVRELVIEIALVQHALRCRPDAREVAALLVREHDAVCELGTRDMTVACHHGRSPLEHWASSG